ncbi:MULTISPECIES: hypothetical protein [Mycobacterium]|uniref:Transposase DDE domain-containing protein n=1 Tax=Mycobacterium kiyosense TaxID=2871094 RepID=A0A9P3UWL9_9MYCO|nr:MULTISPECIES: hypothetical protein [Mycobacterium]BDB41098.1 hypothetical protein IWGMT90018_15440 [Mycobacterium kiyosense]BDE12892.1 hypothetical protein MKCMC460_17520 [Mycobacterium sp. 20KCMC460]GLB85309.1 hypothetical protein SRL2020028_45650 [Mycobacterium kiyosense]GLB92243.1 hypothetical protein SRL2020130_50600 [Mycobacterium kiyosense]GLB98329.1 hypothetical protein SRL2020226_51050 [Mycobacterium kiyosense]
MAAPATTVWLTAGYALVLLGIGWCFDAMARHASARAAAWRTGQFRYRPDHDAWVCPQDHWLWPSSFDPKHRVMRYRALPVVCNSCPVKSTCTTSDHGREISREIDPWPHSEAGRFHRGIACAVAAFGIVLPSAMLFADHSVADVLVLAGTILVVGLLGLPLARHLWHTPANAPDYLPHRTAIEDQVAAAVDRYSTRWGGWEGKEDKA